jgi:hypothetical protein
MGGPALWRPKKAFVVAKDSPWAAQRESQVS